jgi:hypothetical protein
MMWSARVRWYRVLVVEQTSSCRDCSCDSRMSSIALASPSPGRHGTANCVGQRGIGTSTRPIQQAGVVSRLATRLFVRGAVWLHGVIRPTHCQPRRGIKNLQSAGNFSTSLHCPFLSA